MSRKTRFLFLLTLELARKYTAALLLGFLVGVVCALIFWRSYPLIIRLFNPIQRIGIVGEFTPSNLPLSIQSKVSLGLTKIAPDGTAQPALAVSWEASDSGKTFTFHLNPFAKWHTGKAVEAGDINYNIRNVTLTAIDANTLKINLSSSYSPFPALVARPIFLPGLRGLGEYKVSSIKLKGDKVQYLKLTPVFGRGLIYEYRFYRTENMAQLAFRLGEIDTLEDLSRIEAPETLGKVQVVENVRFDRIVTLFFNLAKPVLAEKTFRQALAYALPTIPEERAFSPISKSSWAYTDVVKKYLTDEAAAKRLLQGSKVATESTGLTITTFASYLELSQNIAENWKKLGIATEVKVENSVPADFDVLVAAHDLPPDPDQYPFWHSTQKQTNLSGFSNVKIDKLLEDGRQETDMEKRKKIYADFQRRLVEEAPAVFLYYPKTYTITRK